ncbi:MAG TPA: VOC family protein [Terracidiphilus sp.]|nr:VOC family protein [Terracidiphilus sp.]
MTEPTGKDGSSFAFAPLLTVTAGDSAVDFYKTAFGAVELFRMENADGSVVAQLRVGNSDFWVVDESPEHQNFSPSTLGGTTVRMVLVVNNPDAVFDRAVDAGARPLWPMIDQPFGWRIGRLADPFGHQWEICKQLSRAA